ncbi:MAG: hypothetical protein JXX14_18520 [Deltaproteobacteria bacterium]|nr:hypothetical protein [Deltaproteobacteria bacterium]
MRIGFFTKISVLLIIASVGMMYTPLVAHAQGADIQAIALKKEAMTAYGNLDMDTAVAKLDQAAAMGPQLAAGTVAQIYISYGVVFVGGHGDNARGQDFFTIARCLDASISIDPLYSTPEVDMIFKMAQARANAQTCPALLANVSYMGGGAPAMPPMQPQPMQPQPMQPQPMQPQPMMQPGMLPPCGIHNSPMQQRKSTELPLMLQMDPAKLVTLDRVVLKYAYDGAATYFEMDMKKGDQGWVTGMLSCDEGQITAFDPSAVTYFIEGYDTYGGLVCGHGSSAQPYTVTMNPSAPIVTGLAGMPTPQMCTECPPWDQECHAAKGGGVPCFSDEECQSGQWCSDTGFCEGGGADGGEGFDDEGSGAAPQKFYINLTLGSGAGYAKVPNQWYVKSMVREDNNVTLDDDFYTYTISGVKRGSAGGMPVRAQVGFHINPRLSIEGGFRFDISAFWRKQNNVIFCGDSPNSVQDGETQEANGDSYLCRAPMAEEYDYAVYGAFFDDRTDSVYTRESKALGKAWLANIRVKMRFLNKNANQLFVFGGLGYGHLYFAPKVSDMDLNGSNDRVILTPGMINFEAGLGFAHYLNRNFGFVVELPIDLVVGEESSFGFNADLMLGISFGG